MDITATRILKAASDIPEYQAISNYLLSRRAFPKVTVAPMAGGTYGTFSSPGFFSDGRIPARGLLAFNEQAQGWNPQAMAPTAVHETGHAAQHQLIKQYYEIKKKPNKTELENQFLGNFQKFIGSSKPEISDWIKKVSPNFAKQEEGYRATGPEALSFAIENSAFPYSEDAYNAPAHIDPTLATTFQLLLDQAQRVQNQQPASQGR